MKRFVGILGGMGTEATQYFYNDIMAYDKGAKNDQDHLEILMHNNSKIEDRTDFILNGNGDPESELLRGAKILDGAGVDFITIPCNTAHYFYTQIQDAVETTMISILKETTMELKKQGKSRIGLLATKGTIHSKVYENMLADHGLVTILPDVDTQEVTNDIIYKIKSKDPYDMVSYNTLLKGFCEKNDLDAIILGCTELSLIQDDLKLGDVFVIDSNSHLARRTYEYGRGLASLDEFYKK